MSVSEEIWSFNAVQLFTLSLFCISAYTYFLLKLCHCESEYIALSVTLLLGWIHCLLFTRIFQTTGFFTIMITQILFSDIFRFLCIIGLIALSFTMATMVLFATEASYQENSDNFYTTPLCILFDFFRLATGIADYTRLVSVNNFILSVCIYIAFVIFSNILLFNLLIAAMSRSYGTIGNNEQSHWLRVRLGDAMVLQDILPPCLQRNVREKYRRYGVNIRLGPDSCIELTQYLLEAPECDIVK